MTLVPGNVSGNIFTNMYIWIAMDVLSVTGVFLVRHGWRFGSVVAAMVMFALLVAASIYIHIDKGRFQDTLSYITIAKFSF